MNASEQQTCVMMKKLVEIQSGRLNVHVKLVIQGTPIIVKVGRNNSNTPYRDVS